MDAAIGFEYSADYALIRAILTEPRCWRRMTRALHVQSLSLRVGALQGIEYIVARDAGVPVAVFLLVAGEEVHFCFVPQAWGRTEPIARAFLEWVWKHTTVDKLLGPVPKHNRLALRLARAVGFIPYGETNALVLTEIRRP